MQKMKPTICHESLTFLSLQNEIQTLTEKEEHLEKDKILVSLLISKIVLPYIPLGCRTT